MGGVQNIALRGMVEVTYWREGYPDQRGIIHKGHWKERAAHLLAFNCVRYNLVK